jgi:hypothetical protein
VEAFPMRYLILSDIHANLTALDACLEAVQGRWEKAVCLGDVVGYGPDPNEVIDRLRSLDAVTILIPLPVPPRFGPARNSGPTIKRGSRTCPPDRLRSMGFTSSTARFTTKTSTWWPQPRLSTAWRTRRRH